MGETAIHTGLFELAKRRFAQSTDVSLRFFEAESAAIARACLAIARRFHQKGRLLAFGSGAGLTDAQHVSVEFVHPVIVGKRALPALALGTDVAASVGLAASAGWEAVYARQLDILGRPVDMALGLDPTGDDPAVLAGLATARAIGMVTLGMCGGAGGRLAQAPLDFCFVVPSADLTIIQETHETLYHVLWELVHVFFDHKGLLNDDAA